MTATEHLLAEFPPVSIDEWEAAIARDLKGADYAKKLIWRTDEGIAVKPYYRDDDLKGLSCLDAPPGAFPYRRGTHATGSWTIREEIDATDAQAANHETRAAVAAGAEAIAFTGNCVRTTTDLEVLLADLAEIPVHFARADEYLIRLLLERASARKNGPAISTGCDALASLEFAPEVIEASPAGFVPFTIHGETFEEAGATATQEIGLAVAAGVDFLAAIEERGVIIDRALAAIEFDLAIGANYFFQIAKLRAFRMLWARAAESFGAAKAVSRARIAARSSHWNKTIYDPHVNILRATTEAMAAVLGSADIVTVVPFDECYKLPDDASRRLARNTQLLLKHEAWLGRVADPGGGSYYLEALTDSLAGEAWKTMQKIEARGGYRKARTEGLIAQLLERSLAAREAAIARRRCVFVGTNQFANPAERALERIDEQRAKSPHRGAQAFEELRMRTERHTARGGKIPRVLLAELGDVKLRAARSQFASNFFACAGFEIATRRFKKTDELASTDAELIVLCSSDPEYAAVVAELMPKLNALGRSTPVIIAGNPENAEELKAAGVADFVHVRSNPLEVLTKWQKQLGVEN
jgi:methylmalonyl-CoA mutase